MPENKETIPMTDQIAPVNLPPHAEILTLKNTISALEDKLGEVLSMMDEKDALIMSLREQLKLRSNDLFGMRSEKTKSLDIHPDQLSIDVFNEPETIAETAGEPGDAVAQDTEQHTRKKRITFEEKIPEDAAREAITTELPKEERICPECGSLMESCGTSLVKRMLRVVPATVTIEEHHETAYFCRRCDNEGIATPMVKSKTPLSPIPGSIYAPETIAYIMVQKYLMGVPLYRIEQDFARRGVAFSRASMAQLLIKSQKLYLIYVWQAMKRTLLASDVLHADETTVQVLKEPGRKAKTKSYMWLYRTAESADQKIVLYEYRQTREATHPKAFLSDWRGYLCTDGYSGYHNLPDGIVVVGCWAHARRKWHDSVKVNPDEKSRGGEIAAKGLSLIDEMFEIERGFVREGLSFEQRRSARKRELEPLMIGFFSWVKSLRERADSTLGKAIGYAMSQRKYLLRVLDDGRLPISNNIAERSIKPFVIARKNFLFSDSVAGAETSAVVMSLIESAKAEGLDPYEYLTHVMRTAPGLDMSDNDNIQVLLPSVFREMASGHAGHSAP
jgi:transposase